VSIRLYIKSHSITFVDDNSGCSSIIHRKGLTRACRIGRILRMYNITIFSSRKSSVKHSIPSLISVVYCHKPHISTTKSNGLVTIAHSVGELLSFHRVMKPYHVGDPNLSVVTPPHVTTLYIIHVLPSRSSFVEVVKTVTRVNGRYGIIITQQENVSQNKSVVCRSVR